MPLNKELKLINIHNINRLRATWKSDPRDEIKREYFQAVTVSILLYGCTTLTK